MTTRHSEARMAPQDAAHAFLDTVRAQLGYAPETVVAGVLHRFPTSVKRSDDAGWCRLFDDLRGGVFGCHRQGISQTWRASSGRGHGGHRCMRQRQSLTSVTAPSIEQQEKWQINSERIARLWAECTPLTMSASRAS